MCPRPLSRWHAREIGDLNSSWHGDDLGDFGDLFSQVALDSHLQCHRAGWTTVAGTVEADLDDAGGRDVDELDITAVGLNGGADEVDDGLYFFADGGGMRRRCLSHENLVDRSWSIVSIDLQGSMGNESRSIAGATNPKFCPVLRQLNSAE